MRGFIIITCLLLSLSGFAQNKAQRNVMLGEWQPNNTLIDPKVGMIKLTRVGLIDRGFGTFLWMKDSTDMRYYYSPMCGNDCIWNYEGKFNYSDNKLTLKFNTYTQHGFCKNISKSYNKKQMKFTFKVDATKKDTLILTRVSK